MAVVLEGSPVGQMAQTWSRYHEFEYPFGAGKDVKVTLLCVTLYPAIFITALMQITEVNLAQMDSYPWLSMGLRHHLSHRRQTPRHE